MGKHMTGELDEDGGVEVVATANWTTTLREFVSRGR